MRRLRLTLLSNKFSWAQTEPAKPLLPLFLATLLAGLFIILSDASPTWLVLVFLACCAIGSAFWFGDLRRVMLFMLIFTTPIDISKALIVSGGVYSPGLSIVISDFFFLGLFALWGFRQFIVRHASIRFDHLHRTALLFLCWLWISAGYSQDVLGGMLAAITYTKFFVTYYLLTQLVRKPEDMRLVMTAFFAGFIMQLLYVNAQILSGSPLEIQGAKSTLLGTQLVFEGAGGLHAFRPSGFLHHPNVLADYLVFLLPSAAALVLLGKEIIGRRAWLAALLVLSVGMIMLVITLSRGGWVSLGVAAIFFVIVGLRRGLVNRQHLMALITAGLIGLSVIAVVYPAAYLRISQSDQRSGESRLIMIDQALLIIRSNLLTGVGLGGYNQAAQHYIPESFSYVNSYFQADIRKGVVHNKYLLVTAELGLIGMGLFLITLWRFFRLLFPLSRWRSQLNFAIALGLSSSIVGQAVFFIFDHFYADVRMAMLWILFGLYHALALGQHGAFALPSPKIASGNRE